MSRDYQQILCSVVVVVPSAVIIICINFSLTEIPLVAF